MKFKESLLQDQLERLKNLSIDCEIIKIEDIKKLYDEHPDDWLLCAEIYEEIYSDPTLIGEKKLLKDHINKFAENKMLYDVINRFINLIEA